MHRILIANRGEIACRIITTCRRMGLGSVAVFSDADADALHTRLADDAIRIGPAEAASSYLNPEAIIAAAQATGADAIHPGYGFLSERTILPQLCAENALTWIGPSARCIDQMGSKIEAKRIARAANIPCVPGYDGDDQSDARLAAEAAAIGYPILVKASAGGGGRGMRRVASPAELPAALASARAEAQSAFGSPVLLLEKLIQRPRHLEVQLAGDHHGNLVHLFERECSIQRSYQKVIEEAPAPNLPPAVRATLLDAALRLGQAIGYDSLGTAEFILEENDNTPYFLEMNTRLQVEHPVTEQVTGLDLVEWQIRIARGEPLPLPQESITVQGVSIEARLNAEEPAANYRPGTGTLIRFEAPPAPGIRTETGVESGSTVTPYYDSMLAKLIATGPTRTEATARLTAALDRLIVLGVPCNQSFLRDIITHPVFQSAHLTTRFLEEAFPEGWRPNPDTTLVGEAALAVWLSNQTPTGPDPWSTLGAFRITTPAGRPARLFLELHTGPEMEQIELTGSPQSFFIANGPPITAELRPACDRPEWNHSGRESPGKRATLTLRTPTQTAKFAIAQSATEILLTRNGQTWTRRVLPAIEAASTKTTTTAGPRLLAPMPGLIQSVEVQPGDQVTPGQTLITMEAMKVVMRLPAPIAGTVARIACTPGETVRGNDLLLEITPTGAP